MLKNSFFVADNKIIVKIHNADKAMKTTSVGGIITSHPLKPAMDSCQIGTAIAMGRNVKTFIKEGEPVLFTWSVETETETLLETDDTGEYRVVTEKQIYGTIKTKNGKSHVQPKRQYVVAEPDDDDFEATKSIFQIPVTQINPQDQAVKNLGVKVGDWIIVLAYGAVPITIKRKVFFFIHVDDILFINDGQHRIAINRKRVSDKIRMASRKETVQLN